MTTTSEEKLEALLAALTATIDRVGGPFAEILEVELRSRGLMLDAPTAED